MEPVKAKVAVQGYHMSGIAPMDHRYVLQDRPNFSPPFTNEVPSNNQVQLGLLRHSVSDSASPDDSAPGKPSRVTNRTTVMAYS